MGRSRRSKRSAGKKSSARAPAAGPLQPATIAPVRGDRRPQIYGWLALALAVIQAACLWAVIPNRLPSAAFHLWTFPVLTAVMGGASLVGGRNGRRVAIAAGSLLMFSLALVIVRILVSAAFLAGVYGAFGKAASMFALVAVALIVEIVGLVPLFHIRYLMSRAGRRAFGDT